MNYPRSIVSLLATVIIVPAMWLHAQDGAAPKLKPLPKFLRSAKLADRYLRTRDIEEILKFERAEPVCVQLLKRSGVDQTHRIEALTKLVELRQSDEVAELIAAIETVDLDKSPEVIGELAQLLPRADVAKFAANRASLDSLSAKIDSATLRQAIAVCAMQSDGSVDVMWQASAKTESRLAELIGGLGMVDDPKLLKQLFARVRDTIKTAKTDQLRIAAIKALVTLPGDMQSAFEILADLVRDNRLVGTCLNAIESIPTTAWNHDRIAELSTGATQHYAELSISDRTSTTGKRTLALLDRLASSLPATSATQLREKIHRLTVQEFDVTTLPEKMLYDVTVLVVEAGRPVRISFRNDDIMPHNLVIGSEPSARVELGLMADEMQSDPDSLAKGYIPESPLVMHASKLIQPDVTDIIEFSAPAPGIYPYVCTFPGHWSKMYGAIQVVADTAEAKIAKSEAKSADELLGIRKVEWDFETLAKNIASVDSGRSFATGQRQFKQASCYSCHKMRGEGGVVGPELTAINEKHKKPIDVLQHIIEPSKEIDDKYAMMTVIDIDGKTYRGIVVERSDEELTLNEKPTESCAPTVIRIEDIDEEFKSEISAMPEKLLNTIVEANEVYDLIAYIMSGGDESDSRFQP